MYAQINSNPCNKSFIFCWKNLWGLETPIGRLLWQYFPHGRMIVHKLRVLSLSQIWWYPMFKSSDVAYWKPSNLNNISFIFIIGYGFQFNFLFIFLKLLSIHTQFGLGFGFAKYGAPHSESFETSSNPISTKHSTSVLNISSCNIGTAYSRKHIGFTSSFNYKSFGSIF